MTFTSRKPIIASSAGVVSLSLQWEVGMKLDFGDVRFCGVDGVTELDYKRATYTSGVSASFLVSAPAGQIYAYFGDPALSYVSTWEPADTVILHFTHENGYVKDPGNPIIAPGPAGAWDDWMVYSCAVIEKDGVLYAFYGGGRNVGAEPRHMCDIGLSTSADDGETWVKQGKVLDKADFPLSGGVIPFSIIKIGDLYHLFVVCVTDSTTWASEAGYVTSPDLAAWSAYTKVEGLAPLPHGTFVMDDPDSTDHLLMYYSKVTDFTIRRARASKAAPSIWTDQGQVLGPQTVYPFTRKTGDKWEMFYARHNGTGYDLVKTASNDGLSFKSSTLIIIPNGGAGAWDENYSCVPRILGDKLFYTSRAAGKNYYEGIGMARMTAGAGSLLEWGYEAGVSGVSQAFKHSGDWGGFLTGGSTGPVIGYPADGKNKTYEIWIYDPLTTTAGFQMTFRLLSSGSVPQVLVGFDNGTSTSKYVYRKTGGSWVNTSINRSLGWHKFTYKVTDSGVQILIDDVLVATDTAFDVDDLQELRLYGNSAGTGYFDDYRVIGSEFVSGQVGTEILA